MSSRSSRRMIGPLPDIRENDTLWKLRVRGRMCVLNAHAHSGAGSTIFRTASARPMS
jgi:hypothetical protein